MGKSIILSHISEDTTHLGGSEAFGGVVVVFSADRWGIDGNKGYHAQRKGCFPAEGTTEEKRSEESWLWSAST